MADPDLIFAVGDVHGELDALEELLDLIGDRAGEREFQVVFLGDYVDRGPRNVGTVTLIKNLTTKHPDDYKAIMGNHEHLMLGGVSSIIADKMTPALNMWIGNGGDVTWREYQRNLPELLIDHVQWMAELPATFETEHYVFAHGGLNPNRPLDAQEPDEVMWIRNWWSQGHDFGKHVVYGHTPTNNGKPRLHEHSTGLDTGSGHGGRLTVGVFDARVRGGPIDILSVQTHRPAPAPHRGDH